MPTVRFQILYIFVILNHSRRQVVHFAVTAHPTMAWVIQQLREAMPFGQQPSYLFRDNDGIYGGGEPVFRGNWDCRSQNGPPVPLAKSIRGKVWRHPKARVVGSRDGP